ncbi:hypothetical protein BFP76_02320 [Amylibacter kogurei]|uniref:Uncharacterized protein n=1 Tax=Paramylibacter kogurei TaxID=1889778 RepID=A0A2G5K3I3_9RHOB|nr:hypothetical protein [Amylibacter kogurei]PIB24098.1 hypothetical protein BFP76_02320 [Amylibacter kogurei]
MLTNDHIEILRQEVSKMDIGAHFTLEDISARHPECGTLAEFGTEVSKSVKDINDNRLDFIVYHAILPNGRPEKSDSDKIIYRRLR